MRLPSSNAKTSSTAQRVASPCRRAKRSSMPRPAEWSDTLTPTAALLFRFSAITFNSHRIHYDRDYAVGVERYPGVVVHGPLTAMLLAGSASRNLGRPLPHAFSYRASAPLFADQPIHITGSLLNDRQRDLGADVAAIRIDGAVAMTAEAR